MIYDGLLAEADHIFEIIRLGGVLSLRDIIAVDHERACAATLHRRSKVELLRTRL